MKADAQAALRRVWLQQELARYRQRSQQQPDDTAAWFQLGRIYWELGDFAAALSAIDQTLALQPGERSLLLDRSAALLKLNRFADALDTVAPMLTQTPDDVEALLQKSAGLRGLQRREEALAIGERLLKLPAAPRLPVLQDQAILLVQLARYPLALEMVDQALTLAPDDIGLRVDRAWLLRRLRRPAEALDEIEAVLKAPATQILIPAQCLKAQILAALWRFDEADALLNHLHDQHPHRVLEQAFEPWRLPDETRPDSLHKRYTGRGLYMAQVFEAQQECDWADWDKVLANLQDLVKDAQRYGFVAGLEPHRLLSLPLDPALQLAIAKAQADAVDALMRPVRGTLALAARPVRCEPKRLRIGYVSGDFRDHATAHLIRKLFQVHDREQFEVFGYSLRPGDGSRYWQDISQACDGFIELYDLSNAEAAARIAADGIEILVDLQGYTRFARPEIFALRPAPVQVAYLAYPGTLGARYIPYIIADPIVLPEALRPLFSEQVIDLDCYQVNDDEQPIADTHLTRASAGLPEDRFVYCCFNTLYKIEPKVFAVWMRILRQVPGSVLWLLANDTGRGTDRLRAAAAGHGIAPERLVFAPRWPKAEHLERHRLADVFLDTFIVNAHTTASDALWAGLPIVTYAGETFQSRVCTSLLSALGLQEWLTWSKDEYERLAVALALDPGRLRDFRKQLTEQRTVCSLFTTERFVRRLEQVLVVLSEGAKQGKLL